MLNIVQKILKFVIQPCIVLLGKTKALLDSPLHLDPAWQDVSNVVEVRIITCARDIVPTICTIKSFIRLSRIKVNIYIHSDTSVTIWHKLILRYHLPCARLVTPQDEAKVKTTKYPYISRLRASWQGKKLVDVNLMKKTPKLLLVDPDVLFYRYPTEIIQWIYKGTKNMAMEDYKSFNVLSRAEFQKYLRVKRISRNINTGIVGLVDEAFRHHLAHIETFLRVVENIQTNDRKLSEEDVYSEYTRQSRHLLEQSAYSYYFSLNSYTTLLSRSRYLMYPKVIFRISPRPFYPNMPVAIHYAGQASRRNFYLDYLLQNKNNGPIYKKMFFLYQSLLFSNKPA